MNYKNSLKGVRVLVTRPAEQSMELCNLVEQRGGIALEYPLLEIRPVTESEALKKIVARLYQYQILIFISRNAVRFGLPLLKDHINTDNQKLFAVGRSTAEALQQSGYQRVFFPTECADSENLLELPELKEILDSNAYILIVRGDGGREFLAEQIIAQGARVDYAGVYQRFPSCYDLEYEKNFWKDVYPDIVTLTSREGVSYLLQRVPGEFRDKVLDANLVVMSERVAQHAQETGFRRKAYVVEQVNNHGIVCQCEELARRLHV